jgi:hypothetical protein
VIVASRTVIFDAELELGRVVVRLCHVSLHVAAEANVTHVMADGGGISSGSIKSANPSINVKESEQIVILR